ncbi:unnamed protein product [Adineta steineri]|uniref:G-protein coupled receptors family 1 profile domain-containing protein n=1 Tax=Adineta steineri TaxID=433720 RepID=A0A818NGB7_9BILA|nr:unnamed protein product [Adineta steineri]CAF0856046.1 unnamed protein product [Adineta steineri]CAF1279434.1 unnamed protein product [Adineta steineri]CAF3606362.1 unnamed protein product [Adineta steineri]CAF3740180.1 unnamed protein product [Adineta steineri]
MSSNTELIRSMTLYGGFPIFICGTIGNLLNIRCLWGNRHNPCVFIILSASIINCIVLFYGLFTRILSVGFNLDWSSTNLIWCKTRVAFSQAGYFMSLTCVCLASIDRFLISCRQEKYRNLSRLSFARWAIFLTIIFWLIHSLPELIYGTIVKNPYTGLTFCSVISPQAHMNYRLYISLPVYLGLLPSIMLILTGLMTYRNTNKLQITRQREIIQKQLTKMMLIQIPIIICSTLPYVIFTEYTVFSATIIKTSNQRIIENIITNIVTLLFYMSFACSFFVFLISSNSFRQEAKLFFLCHRTNLFRNIQIQPHPLPTIRDTTL